MKALVFIETSIFEKQIKMLLNDDEYRELQNILIADPESGALIRGGGGIRKIRYGRAGTGKSGGVRAIYYYIAHKSHIYMLVVYPKSKKDNLTKEETAVLYKLVKTELER